MIRFACPRCFTTFEVSDSKAETKFNCEVCGKRVQVPSPFTTPSVKSNTLAVPLPSESPVAAEAEAGGPASRVAYVLLKCIGRAVVKNVVNFLTLGVGGDILVDAWDYWQEAAGKEQRPAQVQAVAQLSPAETHEAVAQIVREEAAALPSAQQAQVAAYLEQVPATVRRTLRGSHDPSGRTTGAGTSFRKPEDLLPLLPAGLPRFKAGDRPLPGVDWELVELLGVGGFGEVWKARNPHFDGVPPVALKFCLDPAAKDRLLKHEAAIINQVMQQGKHKGIVPLLHTYLSADPPCLDYEYVDGGDLAGLIRGRRGGLPARQCGAGHPRSGGDRGFRPPPEPSHRSSGSQTGQRPRKAPVGRQAEFANYRLRHRGFGDPAGGGAAAARVENRSVPDGGRAWRVHAALCLAAADVGRRARPAG